MKRTWLIRGVSSDFGKRFIQNLIKNGKAVSGVVRTEQNLLLLGQGTGRVDVAINVLK
ncbi:hypothetical protein [Secundilactobacillus kimchicus]|uniref:hypothetical protein n=1 Tax=Secundilactobacillus kimchicus TaxID=528209 RepID=UPI0024A8E6F0|nr:hypothetical protein [Secundilactobacillus kimchicus]